jgi:hypothetical protein
VAAFLAAYLLDAPDLASSRISARCGMTRSDESEVQDTTQGCSPPPQLELASLRPDKGIVLVASGLTPV